LTQRLRIALEDEIGPQRVDLVVDDGSGAGAFPALARLGGELSVGERESCEALTSRFARLNDFLVQRVFRTLDQIELMDEGSPLDRLQRAEARSLIASAERWRELRMLRSAIAHDYLIESADRVFLDTLAASPELHETADRLVRYVDQKHYC